MTFPYGTGVMGRGNIRPPLVVPPDPEPPVHVPTCGSCVEMSVYDDFNGRTTSPGTSDPVTGWGTPSSGRIYWFTDGGNVATYVSGGHAIVPFDGSAGDNFLHAQADGVNPSNWQHSFTIQGTFEYDTAVPTTGDYEHLRFSFSTIHGSPFQQSAAVYIGSEVDDPSLVMVHSNGVDASVEIATPPVDTPIYLKYDYDESTGTTRAKAWWSGAEPDWMVEATATGQMGGKVFLNIFGSCSDGYAGTLFVDDVVTSGNRCESVQFDDFDRTVSGGWGVATNGYAWGTPGTGTYGVNSNGAFATLPFGNGSTMGLGGAPTGDAFEMTARFLVTNVPGSTSGDRMTLGFFDASNFDYEIYLNVSLDPSEGQILVYGTTGSNSVVKTNWVSNQWYYVKWGFEANGANRVKVWEVGDPEPSAWDVEIANSGPNFSGVLDVNTDSFYSTTSTIRIRHIEFDYDGKPCYIMASSEFLDSFSRTVAQGVKPDLGISDSGHTWTHNSSDTGRTEMGDGYLRFTGPLTEGEGSGEDWFITLGDGFALPDMAITGLEMRFRFSYLHTTFNDHTFIDLDLQSDMFVNFEIRATTNASAGSVRLLPNSPVAKFDWVANSWYIARIDCSKSGGVALKVWREADGEPATYIDEIPDMENPISTGPAEVILSVSIDSLLSPSGTFIGGQTVDVDYIKVLRKDPVMAS